MPKQFVTPPNLPESVVCRTLKIPSSKEWLGIFNSALLDTLNQYEWLQVNDTDLTIEETIAICHTIINEYWATEGCGDGAACVLPDGSRVLRLSASGHVQELQGEEWVDPTGDYAIPPVPARPEPTPFERRCNAAANAENVLQLVYETVTDGIASDLSDAEIMANMIAVITAVMGAWIGFIMPALAALLYAAFLAFLEIAQFITMDSWDAEFSDILKCVLLECASDTGDVVTFDFQCVNNNLANAVELTGENALEQLRLFGQVQFMLSIIGVDGLNAAGATTAISGADCSDCDAVWCKDFNFANGTGMHGWDMPYGQQYPDGLRDNDFSFDGLYLTVAPMAFEAYVISIHLYFNGEWNGTAPKITVGENQDLIPPFYAEGFGAFPATMGIPMNVSLSTFAMALDRYVGGTERFGGLRLQKIRIQGTGDNPFGEDNCDDEE